MKSKIWIRKHKNKKVNFLKIKNHIGYAAAFPQTPDFAEIIMATMTDSEKWMGTSFHGL